MVGRKLSTNASNLSEARIQEMVCTGALLGRGKMQVHGGLFQIAMAQQNLNGADIRARFEEMRGEAVAQSVRVQIFLDARSLSGFLARIPNRFRVDRPITA